MEARYPVAYNLGCGNRIWPGWINVDLDGSADLKADLRDLPILSDSADAVAAIHVLEHFYEWDAEDLLREWKRILKPGGRMILELPCLDKVFAYIAWCVGNKESMMPFMTTQALYGDPKHKSVEMLHKTGYFAKPLMDLLAKIGMREIQFCTPAYHFAFRDMRVESIK